MNADPVKPGTAFDALVFDVGGIFILHDNERLFRRLAASSRARDALDRIRAAAMDPDITTGARSVRALHEELVRDLGYTRDWRGFLGDWSSHFTVDHAMLDLLARLAGEHRVLLFSNTNREHWEYVALLADGALGRYDAYLSHEIHDMKPNASSFQTVAARAGIKPHRSVFVDDLAENVAAARSLGFQGHIFVSRDNLERYLGSLGVLK